MFLCLDILRTCDQIQVVCRYSKMMVRILVLFSDWSIGFYKWLLFRDIDYLILIFLNEADITHIELKFCNLIVLLNVE